MYNVAFWLPVDNCRPAADVFFHNLFLFSKTSFAAYLLVNFSLLLPSLLWRLAISIAVSL